MLSRVCGVAQQLRHRGSWDNDIKTGSISVLRIGSGRAAEQREPKDEAEAGEHQKSRARFGHA